MLLVPLSLGELRESLVLGTEAKSDPVSSYTTVGLFMWLVLFSWVCWGRLICFHVNAHVDVYLDLSLCT